MSKRFVSLRTSRINSDNVDTLHIDGIYDDIRAYFLYLCGDSGIYEPLGVGYSSGDLKSRRESLILAEMDVNRFFRRVHRVRRLVPAELEEPQLQTDTTSFSKR